MSQLDQSSRTFRTITEISGPLIFIKSATGVGYGELVEVNSPDGEIRTGQVIDVSENSPAAVSGIIPGDVILKINEVEIDSMEILASTIQSNLGSEITLYYERDGISNSINAIPRIDPPEGEGALGIVMTNPIKDINVIGYRVVAFIFGSCFIKQF